MMEPKLEIVNSITTVWIPVNGLQNDIDSRSGTLYWLQIKHSVVNTYLLLA
jgi:hypothetical protein